MCANKMDIPESGAVFTIGQTYLSDNHQSYFFIKNDKVKKLICGNRQSAVVCESGRLFVWGENQYGQLGIGTTLTATKPTCVKAIKVLKLKVQDVCYGDTFSIILTDASRVFYSGKCILSNNEEYNNIFKKFTNGVTTKPIEITELIYSNINSKNIKLKTISAGVSHFTYLTENGKVFSTIAEAAIDKNLDLPNDNIEIKTNWFICPDELVKNIEHASCGKYSTVIVTCTNIIYIYGQINQLAFTKFTQIKVKQFETEEIFSIHISHMDDIYVITKSGKTFKSNINNKNQIEFVLINLLNNDEKIIKLVTGDNFIVVITENGKLYTSFMEEQMRKQNDDYNNNNNYSYENLKELSKLQRLNVNFVSSGLHHYLAHALPLELNSESSVDVVLPPLNLKNAEIFKSEIKIDRHLNLPESNIKKLSPKRENIVQNEETPKFEESNVDTDGRQSTHSNDTVIEASIKQDKINKKIDEDVTKCDIMETNNSDNNLNEQVTTLNRTYSAKSTAFLLSNAANTSNQSENEIKKDLNPVVSNEDDPISSADAQDKECNETIMNKANEQSDSGRISLDSMHPNIGSAMSKSIANPKELKAPSSAHEMKAAQEIIQESQMLQDYDEEINQTSDKKILFNKRPSLKYLDRSISQDKLDEIAKRIEVKSVDDTNNANAQPVKIYKIQSDDIENIINSDEIKKNDNLEIVRLKDKENNEEVYFIVKNENLNQNTTMQTSSSEEESYRSNDVRFINNGIDVTDTVTLNSQGIIMLKQNVNLSSNSDSSDTGISTAKSSEDLEDTLLGEELSKLSYEPVRDSKMETQERLRQVIIEDKLSPIDCRHRVKTPLPKQGFNPMDESDDDDEKTTATINSKSGENPFDSDDENINQIIKDEIAIDKSEKQKDEGGKVKKIFNEIKTNMKEISCRNIDAVDTDLNKIESGQAQPPQANNGKTSKVCTIL